MTYRRIIIIIAVVIVLVVVLAIIFRFLGSSGNTPVPAEVGTVGTLPGPSNASSSAGSGSAFTNSGGAPVSQGTEGGASSSYNNPNGYHAITIRPTVQSGGTKSLTITPAASDASGDYYLNTLTNASRYDMLYYAPDGSFTIVLLDPSNLASARTEAEAAFLSALNVNQATACKFEVSLRVPYGVNADASGVDYRLSFCPGSKPLPKQ